MSMKQKTFKDDMILIDKLMKAYEAERGGRNASPYITEVELR